MQKFNSIDSSSKKIKPTDEHLMDKIKDEFQEIFEDYQPIKLLGQGSYGIVIQVKDKKGKKFAVKKFTNLYRDKIDTKRILREIAILAQLSHPRIVKLHDIIIKDKEKVESIYLILECLDVDLKKILFEKNFNFHMKDLKRVFYDFISGLDYLHRCGILHRDLKPGNIVLNADYSTKICDFGLARDLTLSFSNEEIMNMINENTCLKSEIIKITEDKSLSNNEVIERINRMLSELNTKLLNNYIDNNAIVTNKESKPLFDDKNNKSKVIIYDKNQLLYDLNQSSIKKLTLKFENNSNKENIPLIINKSFKYGSKENEFIKPKNLLIQERSHVIEKVNLIRNLTHHVSTRWYRAPEIILLEDYSSASDVWAAGCIFGEMLGKVHGNDYYGSFFKGTSCFPLSPNFVENKSTKERMVVFDNYDQLNVIFNIMGTPRNEELSFLSEEKLKYVKKFASRPSIQFQKYFPFSSSESLVFLKKMLKFNPKDRITIPEILKDPLFADCKYDHYQEVQILNKFDKDNYDQDFHELKQLFLEQLEIFQNNKK